jgi:integrase
LKPAPKGKRDVVWDGALPSFGVRVTDKGSVSFFVMRRPAGGSSLVRVGLGAYPATSLAEARQRARQALSDLTAGVNPIERRTAEKAAEAKRAANTVDSVVDDFVSKYASNKRTGAVIGQLLRRELVSRWTGRPINEITRSDVVDMIEAIAERSPSAARQAWIYTQRLYGWAINRGTYGLEVSPCDRISITDLTGSPKARERVLADWEVRIICKAAERAGWPLSPFVRLLFVLGCRRGELAEMQRDELDLDRGLWSLPGSRVKNEQPRTIPLPSQAVEILRAIPKSEDGSFVFTTTEGERPISGFSKLKARLDKLIAEDEPERALGAWTIHDIRRTMRTHLSALPIGGTIAEMMIGHKQRGIRAVYDRYAYLDEQRAGFELWAQRLDTVLKGSDR